MARPWFLPQGVTAMIDEGAIFKLRKSSIQVGSSSVAVDLSGSAIQVLGTPNHSVIFNLVRRRDDRHRFESVAHDS